MGILGGLLKNLGYIEEEEIESFKPVNILPATNKKEEIFQTKNLVTVKPKTFSDIEKVVDALIIGECSIIDMSGIKFEETVRIIDFLSGAVYSLRAELKRLQGNLYLVLPSTIKLNNLV